MIDGVLFRKNRTGEFARVLQSDLEGAEKYMLELSALKTSQLHKLYEDELAKYINEIEKNSFFNKKQAIADFDYWSKMAQWTISEAVALSLGKNPEVVNPESLKSTIFPLSPFVRQYQQLSKLANRAVLSQMLFDPVYPSIFVKWVKENDISFPEELYEKVMARRGNYVDWKKMYEDLLEKNNKNVELANEMIAERDQQINDLSALTQQSKPLHTKEKETLLKLVIGMAVKGYGHDPKASRTSTVGEIKSDLDLLGINLDEDTIRKWLRESAEYLPPDYESPED